MVKIILFITFLKVNDYFLFQLNVNRIIHVVFARTIIHIFQFSRFSLMKI